MRELARVARSGDSPLVKLEGALEVLFGAYGEGDPHLSELLVDGWSRARDDKQFRLTMAWLREQSRLSLEEILEEGMAEGAFQRRARHGRGGRDHTRRGGGLPAAGAELRGAGGALPAGPDPARAGDGRSRFSGA